MQTKFGQEYAWENIRKLYTYLKFFNGIVPQGTAYAIFESQSDKGRHFLVSMGDTPLIYEQEIEMTSTWNFIAPKSKNIIESVKVMVCLPINLSLLTN